jgi:hypothetical protein
MGCFDGSASGLLAQRQNAANISRPPHPPRDIRWTGPMPSPMRPQMPISTTPFRKLRIAESEHGLQNFTESGYGFRIYGIEEGMYRISRGIIFLVFFLEIADSSLTDSTDHGFRTDSTKNGAPLPHAAASPHRAPPPRPGHTAWPGAAPRRGTPGRW